MIAYLDAQVVYPQIKKILSLNQETLHEFVQQVYHQHPSVYENLKDLFSMHLLLKYYHDFYEFKTKLYRSLRNKLSYPLLLIGCVYGLMGFFLMNVFPMLFGLIQSFDVQMGNLQLIYRVLVFLFVILSILLSIVVIFLLLMLKRQNLKLFVILMHRIAWFAPIKMIYTQMFAYMFDLILKFGASTQQILTIMKDSTLSYFVGWLAQLTTYQLEEGETLIDSIDNDFLDEQFVSLIKLSSLNHQIEHYLAMYLTLNEKRLTLAIDHLSSHLKKVTYVLLALLMLLFYQVLLAPMQMMNQL